MGARSLSVLRGGRGRLRFPSLPSPRVARRWLIAILVLAVALACGYFLWLRDSSLVAVERVTVTGADGEPGVQSALTAAAEEMTTLHVDRAALEEAVAGDPSVLSISTSTDFPHGLTIEVDSRRPVAYLPEGNAIVAGDGVVLETGAEAPDGLPVIDESAGAIGEPGSRLEAGPLALARILGAVPEPLQGQAAGGRIDEDQGPTITVGEGIELRFGDPAQAERKWAAAAAVLADPGLRSAVYIDVSVPSRPVVG